MSFSDKISKSEEMLLQKRYKIVEPFTKRWSQRKEIAYFKGALSDCANAVQNHHGNVNYCARAKVVLEASQTKNILLAGIKTTSNFTSDGDLNLTNFTACLGCTSKRSVGSDFASDLLKHKYLIDFPGAGNWSRRTAVLLRAGGLIFKAESSGHQFYDLGLKPGIHYIPFDPGLGEYGSGNLLSRLEWARDNDQIARSMAQRAENFGKFCLKESSIDRFVELLLKLYESRLQGLMSPKRLIDLSTCICGSNACKFTKLCKEAIQKCWLISSRK